MSFYRKFSGKSVLSGKSCVVIFYNDRHESWFVSVISELSKPVLCWFFKHLLVGDGGKNVLDFVSPGLMVIATKQSI